MVTAFAQGAMGGGGGVMRWLLIGKSSPCGGSGFPLSLSE